MATHPSDPPGAVEEHVVLGASTQEHAAVVAALAHTRATGLDERADPLGSFRRRRARALRRLPEQTAERA